MWCCNSKNNRKSGKETSSRLDMHRSWCSIRELWHYLDNAFSSQMRPCYSLVSMLLLQLLSNVHSHPFAFFSNHGGTLYMKEVKSERNIRDLWEDSFTKEKFDSLNAIAYSLSLCIMLIKKLHSVRRIV